VVQIVIWAARSTKRAGRCTAIKPSIILFPKLKTIQNKF